MPAPPDSNHNGENMGQAATITFYPVGNGDTEQIVLVNDRRVLFDFCITELDRRLIATGQRRKLARAINCLT